MYGRDEALTVVAEAVPLVLASARLNCLIVSMILRLHSYSAATNDVVEVEGDGVLPAFLINPGLA